MEHVRIMNTASSGDNSLNNYFDKLANKYHSERRAHYSARLHNHPGMLHHAEMGGHSGDLTGAVDHVNHLAQNSLDQQSQAKILAQRAQRRAAEEASREEGHEKRMRYLQEKNRDKQVQRAVRDLSKDSNHQPAAPSMKMRMIQNLKTQKYVEAQRARANAEKADEEKKEKNQLKKVGDWIKAQNNAAKKTKQEEIEKFDEQKNDLKQYLDTITKKHKQEKEAEEEKQSEITSKVRALKRRMSATKRSNEEKPFQIKKVNGKVELGFYMESMCPGCKYYTSTVLKDLITNTDFNKLVDFKLYPYGNGRISGDSIQCQHGEPECEGNTILACMQSLYPVTETDPGFARAFVCMEESDKLPAEEAKRCSQEGKLDYDRIMTCARGDEGKRLAMDAARATENLNPPHEYAPWVTLAGQPLRDSAYDLQSVVCQSSTLSQGNPICSSSALKISSSQILRASSETRSVCRPN
mmetsp:Transcript_51217/g.159995  ORF Transcript_51217/g.159995 Transcript_51217/m.159995 type:complete len:467 (-) Transcript_51217:48-1448(-)